MIGFCFLRNIGTVGSYGLPKMRESLRNPVGLCMLVWLSTSVSSQCIVWLKQIRTFKLGSKIAYFNCRYFSHSALLAEPWLDLMCRAGGQAPYVVSRLGTFLGYCAGGSTGENTYPVVPPSLGWKLLGIGKEMVWILAKLLDTYEWLNLPQFLK